MWHFRSRKVAGIRSFQHHFGRLTSDIAYDDHDDRRSGIRSHL